MYNVSVVQIENIIGKPVSDQNFFGRDAELEDLESITKREHVLMLAPRRVGKTSLLHALAKHVDRNSSAIGSGQTPDGATLAAMTQVVAALVPEAERVGTLKWVVDVLANDGYLVAHADRWRFRSGLLRRYWVRHAG
jgi:hypothetical protein